ncbi:MAG: flagellar hook-length control protein FliK [Firmicutes bacterium]|nr:flagellar hook-length control protein FliK [Bacillota bacterium]
MPIQEVTGVKPVPEKSLNPFNLSGQELFAFLLNELLDYSEKELPAIQEAVGSPLVAGIFREKELSTGERVKSPLSFWEEELPGKQRPVFPQRLRVGHPTGFFGSPDGSGGLFVALSSEGAVLHQQSSAPVPGREPLALLENFPEISGGEAVFLSPAGGEIKGEGLPAEPGSNPLVLPDPSPEESNAVFPEETAYISKKGTANEGATVSPLRLLLRDDPAFAGLRLLTGGVSSFVSETGIRLLLGSVHFRAFFGEVRNESVHHVGSATGLPERCLHHSLGEILFFALPAIPSGAEGKALEPAMSGTDVFLEHLAVTAKEFLAEPRQRQTILRLKLHPMELGEVIVRIALKNHRLSVSFFTTGKEAKEAIVTSLPQLQQQLEEFNIHLENVIVQVGGQDPDFSAASFTGGGVAQGESQRKGGWPYPRAPYSKSEESLPSDRADLYSIQKVNLLV